ncbi:MAG: hypothetical protein AAF849_09535 [Bacteroidota bacterium]
MKQTGLEIIEKSIAHEVGIEFDGLGKLIENSDSSRMNIILLHGVKRKEVDHFKPLCNAITEELGFFPYQEQMLEGNSKIPITLRSYRKKEENRVKKIVFYDINWSAITKPLKDAVEDYDLEDNDKTALSSWIKRDYFVDVFGDLAAYLSEDYIRQELYLALEETLEDIRSKNAYERQKDIAMISGGFGSKIFFDFLDAQRTVLSTCRQSYVLAQNSSPIIFQDAPKKAAFIDERLAAIPDGINEGFIKKKVQADLEQHLGSSEMAALVTNFDHQIQDCNSVLKRLSKVYLLSNHLPFVSLFELNAQTIKSENTLPDLLYRRMHRLLESSVEEPLEIISFFDNDDLMGYELPPSPFSMVRITNVQISNGLKWSVDAEVIRKTILSGMNNPVLQSFTDDYLQLSGRQDVMLGVARPSELAQQNKDMIKYIAHGTLYKAVRDSQVIVPLHDKLKKPRKRQRFLRKKERPGTFSQFITRRFINYISKRIDIRPMAPSDEYLNTSPFKGIQKSVQQYDTTNVVVVHGMRSKHPNYFNPLADELACRLNFISPPIESSTRTIFISDSAAIGGNPLVSTQTYVDSEGKYLCFYIYYWSPITKEAKAVLSKSYRGKESPKIPEFLQDKILHDGFGDVALSMNGFQFPTQQGMDSLFKYLSQGLNTSDDSAEKPDNVFMISGSLGSKILYDYLGDRIAAKDQVVKKVLSRTDKLFMMSNQLPIIALKDWQSDWNRTNYGDKIFDNLKLQDSLSLEIVSFYDPSDVLGYRLKAMSKDSITVKPVPVYIAKGFSVYSKSSRNWTDRIVKKIARDLPRVDKEERRDNSNQLSDLERQLKEIEALPEKEQIALGFDRSRIEAAIDTLKIRERTFRKNNKKYRDKFESKVEELKKIVLEEEYVEIRGKRKKKLRKNLIVRLDIAHEGWSSNEQVIRMLCFGTDTKLYQNLCPEKE